MKYANYFIFIFLLSIAIFFKDNIRISTNLLSSFAPKDSIEKFNIANELGYSQKILLAVPGFDRKAQKSVKSLALELSKLENIEHVVFNEVGVTGSCGYIYSVEVVFKEEVSCYLVIVVSR